MLDAAIEHRFAEAAAKRSDATALWLPATMVAVGGLAGWMFRHRQAKRSG
jgi:hypothetical protein